MKKKIYIVMPVINCLDLTKDAFESIRTKHEFGFILIDQDSTDKTEEWGLKMQDKFPETFKYIKNSTRISLAAAWNRGVKVAFEDKDCEYVGIFNNDILLHEKTIDNLIAFMDKTGYLLVTADNIADKMSPLVMQSMELPKEYTDYDLQEINDWRAEGPDFSCFIINRQTIEVIGWFDEKFEGAYCEDQDYHVRIARARAHALTHNDQAVAPSRIHAKRLSTAPYFHFASMTIKKNVDLRPEIVAMHNRNQGRYLEKWGTEHPNAMDGLGNIQPFGDATKNWRNF